MRFVALFFIVLSLPIFCAWIRQNPRNRQYAYTLLGVFFFLSGVVQTEASLVAWPMWAGTVRGIPLSAMDMLAVSLIITRKRSPFVYPLLWTALLYLFIVVISMIPAMVRMATFFYVFQLLRVLLLYFAITPEISNRRLMLSLFQGLAVGLIIQAGFSASQKAHGVVQAHGTLVHQNTLGMMTELAMLPMIGMLLGGVRSRILQFGVLAGVFIAMASGSRGTMAISAVAIFILLVLSLIQNVTPAKTRILGLTMLALVAVTPIGVLTLKSRFGNTSVLAEETQRAAMERAARAMANDYPFGVGANLYVPVSNTKGYSMREGVAWGGGVRGVPAHNAYLLARAETGWLGELSFILLFFMPAIAGLRYAFRYRKSLEGSVALGVCVGLFAVAYHTQFEFVTQVIEPQALWFMDIAIIGGIIRARRLAGSQLPSRKEATAPAEPVLQPQP